MESNVYIAGLPRGGTTLLSCILGQHSMIEQMGESMYSGVLDLEENICSCGGKPCHFWARMCEEISNYPSIPFINHVYGILDKIREPDKVAHNLTIQTSLDEFDYSEMESLLLKACDGLDKLSMVFRKIVGDFIFVDNTKEICFADNLRKEYGWKIILVTRDPRGMAWSSRKSGIRKGVPRPISSKIPVYTDFARRAIYLREQKNVFYLQYEDLCDNPLTTVKDVCNFLNIPFEKDMLHFKRYKGHVLMGNRMMHNRDEVIKNDLSWKSNLTDSELKLIIDNCELKRLYSELGYRLN